MSYMDAFVCAVRKDRIEAYKALARKSVPLWKEFGATDYVEAMGDDVPYGEVTSFPRAVQAKDDEVVVVAYAVFPDKATRDRAGKAMGEDPRFRAIMEEFGQLSDMRLMIYGGFVPIATS
jgi:uncharacterized protein YbaA (DUF1428 family)